jgi:PilZ domain
MSHARSNGPQTTNWQVDGFLERREHTRYGVHALVDFEWVDEGVTRRGHGTTRDISTKGMFIFSTAHPPAKADILVNVSFRDVSPIPTKLQMRAKGLVIRVEEATEQDSQKGFAILNRSFELRDGENALQN